MAKEAKPKKSKAEIELDKMLAEARAAEAEQEAKGAESESENIIQQSEPAKQEPQKQPEEKKDYLLLFFVGIVVVFAIGGFFLYSSLHHNFNLTPSVTGLAAYNPQPLLKDWTLDVANTNLAEMPASLRVEMMSQSVVDAATWEFHKGDETLYFWTKIYSDNDTREKYDDSLVMGINWKGDTTSQMAMGDKSMVGIYRSTGDAPLMILIESGKQIWYVSYHNRLNADGSGAYDATNITTDKQFLVSVAKKFYDSFQNSS